MSKFPQPWYRPARGVWYVTLHGKQHNLGPDREAALAQYGRLLAAGPPQTAVAADAVVTLLDTFLEWCQQHRAAETYGWYLERLEPFAAAIGPDLTVKDLKPYHVQQWVDAHPHWKNGTRRNAIAAVKRALHWAEEQGYLDRSPIAHLKKPRCGKKETVMSEAHYRAILEGAQDDAFRDLVTVTWETGCRPQESLRVEARHVDLVNQRWVIPTTPGKPDNRVVYLTDNALAIVRRRMKRYRTGPLFRNSDGRPWTTDAVNCRFQRFLRKLGVRYSLYAIRHTWITRMLQTGVDSLTVAILAGHKDPSMLARHYAHLSLNPQHLLSQARRGVG